MPNPLTFELVGDTQLVVTRDFDAPPELVWRAHMEPELVKKWQSGHDDWNVVNCVIDAAVGGFYRMDHQGPDGGTMSITGTFLEVDPPHRVVQEEVMLMPDPTPPNHIVTEFTAKGTGTRMTMTMTLPDAETRQMMIEMGVLDGMEVSFASLDALDLA